MPDAPTILGCYCSWMEPWKVDSVAIAAGVRSAHPGFPGLHMCYFANGKRGCTLEGGPAECKTRSDTHA